MEFQQIIREYLDVYQSKNRREAETMISDDFQFTSPDDPLLDKALYFEKCWPFSEQVRKFEIVSLIGNGSEGFVKYICETNDGRRFTNTEFMVVRNAKICKVEVYYGWNIE